MGVSSPGWPLRLWESLHEPRAVTAVMIACYGVLVALAASILAGPGRTPLDVVLGCILLAIGGGIGVISAWRGAFWAEGPALLLAAIGLTTVTVVDALRVVATDQWPGWPSLLAVALVLMLLVRALRIWPMMWAPGREPDDELRRKQRRALVATVAMDAALSGDDE